MKDPKLFLMVDNSPEFDLNDELPFVEFLGIDVDTPSLTNGYQDNVGIDGSLFTTATINKNIVNMRLSIPFGSYQDLKSKTQSVNRFFYQKKIYRLRTSAEPMMVQFVRPVGFEVKPIADGANDCLVTIPFENSTGYKFSRYDSLNQLDLWDDFPLGFDLPAMTKSDFHIKDQSIFKLLNPSGVPIDPYEENHKLKIIMSWNGPKIALTNLENDSTYSYFGDNDGNTEIVLDGVETFKRDQQVNANTDFGNIKLEPGFNRFRVDGTNQFEIKFDFPFLYV